MAEGKRYYWLKLKEDFFQSKRIKKLRHMAGGDTYTIIYLKMQLLSLQTDGVLEWTGLEDNFAKELALDLDEKPEDVEITLMYLLNTGLAETCDNKTFLLPWVIENTGSETASTKRVRDFRERKKALQCNASETQVKQVGNVEKEIEKEIELEIEKDDICGGKKPPQHKRERQPFQIPTLEEVTAYCKERGNTVDPQYFIDHYASNGWKVGKTKMVDWKAAVRTWERNGNGKERDSCNVEKSATEWGIQYANT